MADDLKRRETYLSEAKAAFQAESDVSDRYESTAERYTKLLAALFGANALSAPAFASVYAFSRTPMAIVRLFLIFYLLAMVCGVLSLAFSAFAMAVKRKPRRPFHKLYDLWLKESNTYELAVEGYANAFVAATKSLGDENKRVLILLQFSFWSMIGALGAGVLAISVYMTLRTSRPDLF